MSTGEKVFERADSERVQERIRQDASQAVQKAIDGVQSDLTGRGFNPKEIAPLIVEGADEAVSEFNDKFDN